MIEDREIPASGLTKKVIHVQCSTVRVHVHAYHEYMYMHVCTNLNLHQYHQVAI